MEGTHKKTASGYNIATIVKAKNGHAWFDRMEQGVKQFRAETGHHAFLIGPPHADEHLQAQLIEQTLQEHVDALCVVPYFPQALELILRQARKQGVVVIAHEASNLRNCQYDLEPFDNTAYGVHLMDHLARYMHEEGEYLTLLGSLTTKSHSEWANAAITHQIDNYPNMTMATRKIEDHDDPDLAYQKTKELIMAHPNLQGILGIGMTGTAGAGRAVAELGRQEEIVVVGTGLVSACSEYLKNGANKLISFWDPADASYVMNTLAVNVLQEVPIEDGMNLGASGYTQIKLENNIIYGAAWIDVTRENMSQYQF